MTVAALVRVEGVVQGVFFRDWTVRAAHALGVTGWVRNRDDGGVELLAEGETARIEELVAQLRRGPPLARVERVTVKRAEPEGATEFTRRATA